MSTDCHDAWAAGAGLLPGSAVERWLFGEPRYLGAVLVDQDGTLGAFVRLRLMSRTASTRFRANGIGQDGQVHSASIGVLLIRAGLAGAA